MKNKMILLCCVYAVILLGIMGCGKEFLDIKRNANQVVPHTVKDYLAIISRNNMLTSSNAFSFYNSDEYYLLPAALNSVVSSSSFLKEVYIWGDDVYESEQEHLDWNSAYENIMYCNLALDIEKLSPGEKELDDWNRTRLAARFYRAWSFYQLAQLFCPVFDEQTAHQDLGLPLRLDYDLSVKYHRSTLKETYDQILKDLHEADKILVEADHNIYLPGPIAVKALLARVYLQMRRYDQALHYANMVLKQRSDLMDFNTLTGTIANEGGSYFPAYAVGHTEVILYMNKGPGGLVGATRFNADTDFLSAYEIGDLRRKIYFFQRSNGTKAFIGSYNGRGGNNLFSGPAVDEMLLIRSECLAREGKVAEALYDINYLRSYRYDPMHYREVIADEIDDIVALVLEERKKELYMRGLRWEDARRLNKEGRYLVTFTRELDSDIYYLMPESKKWIWPLPPNEIARSGLVQNER